MRPTQGIGLRQAVQAARLAFTAFAMLVTSLAAQAQSAGSIAETTEIAYSTPDAQPLRDLADELRTPVAIYEYVRNNIDYLPYWGSQSGSVNTLLGQRGNDVDQASLLQAMLRYRGVKTRYATGTIQVSEMQIRNWMAAASADVAVSFLKNSGIASSKATGNDVTVDHVWVEALLPYDQYRGQPLDGTNTVCAAPSATCAWVPLDPSYKLRNHQWPDLDPYTSVIWNDSKYSAYYDALRNDDADRKNRNPVEIVAQDVTAWLRADPTRAGKALSDVRDEGEIIPAADGLLPAALPYKVSGASTPYDSVQLHDDAQATRKWGRLLTVTVSACRLETNSGIAFSVPVSSVSTDRLVLTTGAESPGTLVVNLVRGRGASRSVLKSWSLSSTTCDGVATSPASTGTYYATLFMSLPPGLGNPPAPTSYTNVKGGRNLVVIGGEISNWSQVHRASEALLAANQAYPIVFNAGQKIGSATSCDVDTGAGCIPFLDRGPAGWDAADPKLFDDDQAMQDLSEGLLEVAGAWYMATAFDNEKKLNGLLRTKVATVQTVGLVQSANNVQYLKDGTLFSVQPTGLVIDLRSHEVTPPIRNIAGLSNIDANDVFKLVAHAGSSLEHEVWQAITGLDAFSAVRAIQVARMQNRALKTYRRDASTNDAQTVISDAGFASCASGGSWSVDVKCPAPFRVMVQGIYSQMPTWWDSGSTATAPADRTYFDFFMRDPHDASVSRSRVVYSLANDGIGATFSKLFYCYLQLTSAINLGQSSVVVRPATAANPFQDCYYQVAGQASIPTSVFGYDYGNIYTGFLAANSSYFSTFDAAQGFNYTDFVYRPRSIETNGGYPAGHVFNLARGLQWLDASKYGSQTYTLPVAPAIQSGMKAIGYIGETKDLDGIGRSMSMSISVTD